MNWVGGARNRLKMKNDKKRQKEFFERQRYSSKVRRMEEAGSPSKRKQAVSLDILSLQAANLSAAKFQRMGNAKKSTRVNHVNLDKSRGIFGQKFVDLPDASPEGKPSKLALCRPSPTTGVGMQAKHSPPQDRHPLCAIPESQENAVCSVMHDFRRSRESSRALHSPRHWTQSPITPWHTGTLGVHGRLPGSEFCRHQITTKSSREIIPIDVEAPDTSHCISEDILSFNRAKGMKTTTKEEFVPPTFPMTPGSGTSEFSSISHVSYTNEVTVDEATVPSVNSFTCGSVPECAWKEKSPSPPACSLGAQVQSGQWTADLGRGTLPPADSSFSSFKDYHRSSLATDEEPSCRPAGLLIHRQSGVIAGQQPLDLTCSESTRFTSPEDSPRRHPSCSAVDNDRLSEKYIRQTCGSEQQQHESDDKDNLFHKRAHSGPCSWQQPRLEDVNETQYLPEHPTHLCYPQMDCQQNPSKPAKVLELCAAQTSSALPLCHQATSEEMGKAPGLSRRDIMELERVHCNENCLSEEDMGSCPSSDCSSSEAISSDQDTDSHPGSDYHGRNWLAFVRGSYTPQQGQQITTTSLCSRSALELQPGQQNAMGAASSSAQHMLGEILALDRELQKSKDGDNASSPLQIADSTDIGVERLSGNGAPQREGDRNVGTSVQKTEEQCSYPTGQTDCSTENDISGSKRSFVRGDISRGDMDEALPENMRSEKHHIDDHITRESVVGCGIKRAESNPPDLQDKGCVFIASTPGKDEVSGGKTCSVGDIGGREEVRASCSTQTELWDAEKDCHTQAVQDIFQEGYAKTSDSMATQSHRRAESGTQTESGSCYSCTRSCTQTDDGLQESCTLKSSEDKHHNVCTQTNDVKFQEGSTQTEADMSSPRQEECFLSPSVPTSTSISDDPIHRADGKCVSDVAVHCTLIGSPIIRGCKTKISSTSCATTDPLSPSVQDTSSSQGTDEYNSCHSTQ